MDYQIIQTGSSGNAVVINGHILIDPGPESCAAYTHSRGSFQGKHGEGATQAAANSPVRMLQVDVGPALKRRR